MQGLDRERILYEISMSIGNTLEIEDMCKETLSVLLKKLSANSGAIIRDEESLNMESIVFSIPRRIKKNQDYMHSLKELDLREYTPILKTNSNVRYIFKLDGFGYLILFTTHEIESLIYNSLNPLLKKITTSLLACENYLNLKKSLINLEQASKVKEQFMANMSHELRTPLNAIIGFSTILEKKIDDKKNKNFAKQIHKSGHSLLHLINDILDLSKIQNSNFTIEPYKFNAHKELEQLSTQFESLIIQKNITFINNIGDELKDLFLGDWHRINQIIINLISNAIKFTPKNGEIECKTNYQGNSLILKIIDNGIGMNKEVQEKIFTPFTQADGTITRKYGGTGLGLSITQSLVELMSGNIALTSKEGEGTTFIVSIPLEKVFQKQNDNVIQKVIKRENRSSLQGHILIVEDNKTNLMLIETLIKDFGLTCDIANDGVEAVNIYNPNQHSIVLMDENMPKMSGLEAMKILHEKYKERCTTIIALTANSMQGDREKFLEAGMDAYLTKPINDNLLYQKLKFFLER